MGHSEGGGGSTPHLYSTTADFRQATFLAGKCFMAVSGRGAARAEDAQGTPTQCHISSSIQRTLRTSKNIVAAAKSSNVWTCGVFPG